MKSKMIEAPRVPVKPVDSWKKVKKEIDANLPLQKFGNNDMLYATYAGFQPFPILPFAVPVIVPGSYTKIMLCELHAEITLLDDSTGIYYGADKASLGIQLNGLILQANPNTNPSRIPWNGAPIEGLSLVYQLDQSRTFSVTCTVFTGNSFPNAPVLAALDGVTCVLTVGYKVLS